MNLVIFYLGMMYMLHGIEMAKRVEKGKTLAYVYLLAAVICFSGLIVQNIF
ncbi:hypothetical protein [Bacillus sp. KH172YL63]|uniref:hypothetical protein n=1 Tax=Bacillus sp. KH172YL63 TaxID=2709784 RepID=UPI0013E41CAF|nr:hypothetical protein [Bacillus sp. KH172YL63]BCB04188.1 hypothetical protein KH172YL63_23210 [Bacillus sp. KH172YL63]